jgi:hypothetical protein
MDHHLSSGPDIDLDRGYGKKITFLMGNYLSVAATPIRNDALFEVGLYNEDIVIEDCNMWLMHTKSFDTKYFYHVVARYRRHDGNSVKISRKHVNTY